VTPKQIKEAARKLDHLAMDALWQENKDLREVLDDNHRLTRELDEALSGPGNAAKQASLCDLIPQAKAMREALREVLDAMGAIGRPWELEGHGIPAKRAEQICGLIDD
jgi:hypothetical protein